jgi:predicted nucleic acid-binding protein
MTVPFLDTNIILRHLLGDDPQFGPACQALFQAIERGEAAVWTSDLVIAEVVFVLSNKRTYNIDRETIRDSLLPIIELPGIKLANKRLYRRVLALYTSLPLDYIDAYHAALMEQRESRELYSYDAHFDRLPGIRRLVPGGGAGAV